MKLHIENIGAIGSVDVAFDGITVIGGENNTGKSTIGKVLFACYQNMAKWGEIYSEIVNHRIEKFLEKYSNELEDYCLLRFSVIRRRTSRAEALRRQFSNDEDFIVAIEDYIVDSIQTHSLGSGSKEIENNVSLFLKKYCIEYLKLYVRQSEEDIIASNEVLINSWTERVTREILSLELDEVNAQATFVKDSFKSIFKNQYIRIGCDSALIDITEEGRNVRLMLGPDTLNTSDPIRTNSHVYYLESPKIYDLLSRSLPGMTQTMFLRMLMSPNFIEVNRLFYRSFNEQSTFLDGVDVISNDDILENLRSVMDGRAEYYQKQGIEFKDNKYSDTVHPQNVSTGLKSLALLEYALRIGVVLPGDILILDEPEINLHPKWQLEYAKTLVQLHKKYNLQIVVSSHSPYFIRSIEIFCDKDDIMDRLNVYLTERDGDNNVVIRNLSYSEYGMSELYDLLASPLDDLEGLLVDE